MLRVPLCGIGAIKGAAGNIPRRRTVPQKKYRRGIGVLEEWSNGVMTGAARLPLSNPPPLQFCGKGEKVR